MGTILLAEAEALIRRFEQRVLEAGGHRVLAACSIEDAVSLSEGHRGPIHVLVAEAALLGTGRRDLVSRLRTKRPGLRVLYVSNHDADVLRGPEGFSAGTFLRKPFTPAELLLDVERLVLAAAG